MDDVFPKHVIRMDSRSNMRGVDNVALDIQDFECGYMEHFFSQVIRKLNLQDLLYCNNYTHHTVNNDMLLIAQYSLNENYKEQ